MTAQRAYLSDGRWHFQHGPIDLVIGANGTPAAVALAHAAAWQRFQTVLQELVAELPLLRQPLPMPQARPAGVRSAGALSTATPPAESPTTPEPPQGVVARRMWNACWPFRAGFITPMAAVAGAVAEELIGCYQAAGIDRAWVNNGGDIAFHLTPGQVLRLGLVADIAAVHPAAVPRDVPPGLRTDAQALLEYGLPVRGVATSGWRGRSFSLGIADSVTVLAATAAQADAAATVIANAVQVAHPAIIRQPANSLRDDSDLGDLLVTTAVPTLPAALVREALHHGLQQAQALQQAGLISCATLVCQGQWQQTPQQTPQKPPPIRLKPQASSPSPLTKARHAVPLHPPPSLLTPHSSFLIPHS